MLQVVTGFTLAVGAWMTVAPAARQSPPRRETIRTEFRIFNGTTDVSGETRLRIRPSGSTETGHVLDSGALAADLPAGIYDVQAVRQRSGQVVSVRWAEKLVVMAYPDEGGRHLEVINFAHEHGALQLRWPEGQAPTPAELAVTVTKAGDSRPNAGPPHPRRQATPCWSCRRGLRRDHRQARQAGRALLRTSKCPPTARG